MRTVKIRQAVTGTRAVVADRVHRLQRPTTTAILCGHCGRWVKPRRYDPTFYVCVDCAPGIAHAHYRNQRDAAVNAAATRHAREKELHAWRRQLASATK